MTLYFFKLERSELDATGIEGVFPSFRKGPVQASHEMDPILDQDCVNDMHAVPRPTGIRLTPRNPEMLAAWIDHGHASLDRFDAP